MSHVTSGMLWLPFRSEDRLAVDISQVQAAPCSLKRSSSDNSDSRLCSTMVSRVSTGDYCLCYHRAHSGFHGIFDAVDLAGTGCICRPILQRQDEEDHVQYVRRKIPGCGNTAMIITANTITM